jgi:tetratricopeptide (TPR) repeat protein
MATTSKEVQNPAYRPAFFFKICLRLTSELLSWYKETRRSVAAAHMMRLSRSIDKHTGSYLALRRRKRITIALAVLAAAGLTIGILVRLGRSGTFPAVSADRPVPKRAVISDWDAKDWDAVRKATLASLASEPLDPFYLCFKGLASFYQAMALPEGQERTVLLDEAVFSLRKALVVAGKSTPKAQMEYVLGKAYYFKGALYYDESVKYMEASLSAGYKAADSREYLALAYAGLGETEKAISNFDAVLSASRSELLLLAAARAYLDAGARDTAETLLLEAVESGTDELARAKSRFLLGEIYSAKGDTLKAENQYEFILKKDPDSAEAHYRLGLVYQGRGDPVRARAEWRKAVSLDPMHAAARQKLSEKM